MEIHTAEQQFKTLSTLINENNHDSTSAELIFIKELVSLGSEGLSKLLLLLLNRVSSNTHSINFIDEYIYKLLLHSDDMTILKQLEYNFKEGRVSLKSELQIDYLPLKTLLINKQFQEADQLTQSLLCKLSRIINNHSRSWLYFTDIASLPITDLRTIDNLWIVYSQGLFGMSIQRNIWLSNNSNWEKFLEKIGWTMEQGTKRYPQQFEWSIKAPKGHLPLFNQLRGIQVLEALFIHPAWGDNYME
jgi:GUN4-like